MDYTLYVGVHDVLFPLHRCKVSNIILVIHEEIFRQYSRAFRFGKNVEIFFPIRVAIRIVTPNLLPSNKASGSIIHSVCQFVSFRFALSGIGRPPTGIHPFAIPSSITVDGNKQYVISTISSANLVHTPCTFSQRHLVTGAVDYQAIGAAAWFGIPIHKDSMGLFAMDGSETFISAVFTIVPIALATMMEHIGDIAAISATTGKNYIRDPGLNKTLLGDGLATAMAGLLGGPANTTYGENTGVLALTKIYDPLVIRIAAVFAMILSFCPKFEAIINTIPSGIVGGISFVLYGMISAIGVRNVVENRVDFSNSRNLIIAAVILVCALGFNSVGGITFAIAGVSINLSGLAIAAIAGILLNALLPGNDYQFDEGSNEPESASLRV